MENERNLRVFIKNGLLLTLSSLVMRMIGVRFNAFITAKIGADGIGLYTLIMSVYGFAVTLATSGVGLASTRMCAEAKDEKTRRASILRLSIYALVCGMISFSALFFGSRFISEKLLCDERCVRSIRLLALSMPFIALSGVFHGYFSAVRKAYKSAAVSVFEQLFRIFATVWLLLYFVPDGLEYACAALVGGGMLSEIASFLAAFLLFLIERRFSGRASGKSHSPDESGLWKKLFSITLPVAAAAYVRSGFTTLEHILIPRGLRENPATAEKALASYGILCGMVMPVIMLPTAFLYSFTGLLIPEFAESVSRGEDERISSMSERAIRLTLCFSLGCAGFMYCFSHELGMTIYNSSECGDFILLMSPLIPVMYFDHAVDSILKGLGEQLYCMKVNILDSAMCALMVFLLCGRIGIYGFVVTIYISEAVNASLSVARLIKRVGMRFSPLTIIKPTLGAAAAISAVNFMPREVGLVSLTLRGSVFLLVYLIIIIVFWKKSGITSSLSRI